ncbi:magnesium transporter CorA family protein [Lentilactobacillus sp. SPB1-3]|uniref:Magnesium transporter CorA family protein n=1 Tax=Lentilactobacillus terminaliae TaxID=3003483 RepID=A0ACD5DGK9_9LACO|nr:magnesium transporter CorA family protein [Lentilactobacillus sp. SPB1-3]MCZ0977003.1 magnesium transporter CorA family protein [Lentilactobacillus sp. SPB1-3]
MIKSHQMANYEWIEAVEPTKSELNDELSKVNISKKYFNYMIDTYEEPRATYDSSDNFGAIVIRALPIKVSSKTTTLPIFIGFNQTTLITVCHDSNQRGLAADTNDISSLQLRIMAILRSIVDNFFELLNDMSKEAEGLELSNRKVTNERLIAISDLKRKLVYLRSACEGNVIALEQFKAMLAEDDLKEIATKENRQLVDDLIIEYRQCQNSFEIVSTVVSEFEDTFGNMLNNRLNQTMQFLTVWSLLLAIPPIVSGFYGMNMFLPWAGSKLSWLGTVIFTLFLGGIMLWYLRKNKKL